MFPQLLIKIIKFFKDHIFLYPFKEHMEFHDDATKIEFFKFKKKFFYLSCFSLRIYLLIFIINNLAYWLLFSSGCLNNPMEITTFIATNIQFIILILIICFENINYKNRKKHYYCFISIIF